MIKIEITFASVAEAALFFAAHGGEKITTTGDSVAGRAIDMAPELGAGYGGAPASDSAPVGEAVNVASKKPGRPKKEKTEPVAAEPAQESAAQDTKAFYQPHAGREVEAVPSIDEVRDALGDYVGRTSFEKGTALVGTFCKADGTPAVRVGDIQEKDRAAFIAKTKEQVAA